MSVATSPPEVLLRARECADLGRSYGLDDATIVREVTEWFMSPLAPMFAPHGHPEPMFPGFLGNAFDEPVPPWRLLRITQRYAGDDLSDDDEDMDRDWRTWVHAIQEEVRRHLVILTLLFTCPPQ